jgi:hypothetical protein
MAFLAMLLKDGQNVFIENRLRGSARDEERETTEPS